MVIPNADNRRISAFQVASIINDPTGNGLTFAGISSENSVILSNVSNMLVGDRINLNLSYDKLNNSIPKHTEWLLLEENSPTARPNALLEKKLLDSILGHDSLGNKVPDPKLTARTRYGIGIRPQQTLFKDRLGALRNLIEFSNSVLSQQVIVGRYNFSNLNAQESIPDVYTHLYDRVVEDNEALLAIDTRKFTTAKVSCSVSNGKIYRVTIDDPGFGYEISPTIKIIGDSKTPAKLSTVIDGNGRVKKVIIDDAGTGYSTAPELEVRPYTVVVQTDSLYNGKWSTFIWRDDILNWVRAQTQRYNTTLYWKYIDWSSKDYNQYQDYNYTVDEVYQLNLLDNVSNGEYIKVKNSGNGNYIILEKIDPTAVGSFTLGYNLVYKENGTIQILESLWNQSNSNFGFDAFAPASSYDQTLYDQTPDLELEYILLALRNDIFINELKENWNKFFFKAVKYALTEQKLLDWAFKTSFINVINNAGSLDQRPVYRLQNTKYFEDYISEVKPYHTSIRGFTTQYSTLDESQTYTTDFDLPAIYNKDTDMFTVVNSTSTVLASYPWKSWNDNHTFTVGKIVVGKAGSGYTLPPRVEIVSQPGDSGYGATAVAYIRSGEVISVEVTNPGQGYVRPPIVKIKGGGSSTLEQAVAYAQLTNDKVRTNTIGMKFDRINRFNEIGDINVTDSFACNGVQNEFILSWLADPNKSSITVTLDKVRVLGANYTIKYYDETYNGYSKKFSKISFLNVIPKNGQVLDVTYKKSKDLYTAIERIENFYEPDVGMPGNDNSQLIDGLDYPRTQIKGLALTATTHWDVLFGTNVYSPFGVNDYADDISYYTTAKLASTATSGTSTVFLNTTTGLKVGQFVNIISSSTLQFTTSTVVIKSITTATKKVVLDAALTNTLTNATFEFWSYDSNSTRLDSAIDGGDLSYTTALGTGTGSIIIDGDGFYTPNTSYAPDEMIPGQVTESIGINVYTKNSSGAPLVFTSAFDVYEGQTSTHALSILPTTLNSISVSYDNKIFEYNSTTDFTSAYEFNIDWSTGNIIVPPQRMSGKMSYTILGVGGGNPDTLAGVVDYQKLTVTCDPTEPQSTYAEVVSLSGVNTVQSAYVTVNGRAISTGTQGLSYTLISANNKNNRAAVLVTGLPSGVSTIQAWFFGSVVSYYNELQEQVFTVYGYDNPQTAFIIDRPPASVEPADAQVIVEINDNGSRRQLLPPYVSYYQVTNPNKRTFIIDNHVQRPPGTYNLTTTRVYRNGKQLGPAFDFDVNVNDNTVTIYPGILKEGDAIAVLGLIPGEYDYDIVSNVLNVPLQSGTGVTNAEIKIITFTDQDGMLMRVERFPGNSNKRYKLSRAVLNLSYLWVSLNGIPLKSGVDYDVLSDQVTVQLSDNWNNTSADDIVITSIASDKLATTILGYRIFVDILGRTHYKRLSKQATTYLLKPLSQFDTEIYVADASVLTPPLLSKKIPGAVLIDGERIEFLEIDGNTLKKLRRGTLGTSPSFYSDINTRVIDQSPSQTVPYSEKIKKQVQFTSASTNSYRISTTKITTSTSFNPSTVIASDGITLSVGSSAIDQLTVYYGGRQLSKVGRFKHDTTYAYDSPECNVLGSTSTVYGLPITTTIGDAYIVTATNHVWVYEKSVEIGAVNGYVYKGMRYLEPEFSINTSTRTLMLNIEEGIQNDIELVIVQKQYKQSDEWNDTGKSLMDSTTTPAKFLQRQPAELPDSWYYGGNTELTAGSGEPLTDANKDPLQGF